MADTLTLTYRKEGILIDPVTVTLSDSTGTYGVKRNSDNTVVVSALTAVSNPSVGMYTYDIGGLDKTYSYTYSFKVTLTGNNVQYVSGFVAAEVGVTYTDLDSIRNILNHAVEGGESKIRFSDSYVDLAARSANSGSVALSGVLMSTSYAGSRNFTITFSSATAFSVTYSDRGNTTAIGSGTVGTDFTASNNWFKIVSSAWSGTAQAGDIVEFRTNSHISTQAVIDIARRSEEMIDSILESHFINSSFSTLPNSLFFTVRASVPKAVRFSATFLSCHFIYTAIYPVHAMLSGDRVSFKSDVSDWKNLAEATLDRYVKARTLHTGSSSPRWYSREPIFDKLILDFSETEDDRYDVYNNNLGVFEVDKNYLGQAQLSYHN